MAENESIGSVSVLIGGDYSPLVAAFGQAQNVAKQAGTAVASAFTGGAASAPGIVDQFGRSVSSAGSASATAAPQVAVLSQQTAGLATNANNAAQALVRQAAAAHVGVTEIQATSGALRVLEGSGGIRAAERFLTMIPGIGSALQAAFPVVGAIALSAALLKMGEEAYKAAQDFIFLTAATEAANNMAKEYAKGAQADVEAIEKIRAAEAERNGQFLEAERIRRDSRNQSPIALPSISKEISDRLTGAAGGPNAALFSQDQFERLRENLRDVIPQDVGTRIQSVTAQIGELKAKLGEIQSSNPLGNSLGIDASANRYALAIDILGEALKRLKVAQDAASERDTAGGLEARFKANQQSAEIQIDAVKSAEAANARGAELEKQRVTTIADAHRQIAQVQIDAIGSEAARRDAAAQADIAKAVELRDRLTAEAISTREAAIANAELLRNQEASAARTPLEQQRVGINFDTRVDTATTDYQKAVEPLNRAVDDAREKLVQVRETFDREIAGGIEASFRNIGDGWQKFLVQMQEGAHRAGEVMARVLEIQDKSQGETGAIAAERAKLELEQQYGLAVVHTAQQQIQYQQTLAQIDAAARQAKIEGAKDALNAVPDDNSPQNIKRAAELQAELDKLQEEAKNADIQANTKILQQQQQITLQYQLRAALAQAGSAIPSALGNALASGLTGGGGRHEDIGQQIAKAMEGLGRQLLGGIFTAAIHQLIASLLATTIAQHVMTAIFGANTSVQATNTAAVAALTAANAALSVSDAAVVTSNAALVAALAANTIAIYTQVGLLGFADGGSPPVGVPSIVGERGPEIFVPRSAGTIVPNHMIKGYAEGAGLSLLASDSHRSSYAHTTAFSGDMHIHLTQGNSPRQHAEQIFRELPRVAKTKSSQWSKYSS
jgi:hypothetical protein